MTTAENDKDPSTGKRNISSIAKNISMQNTSGIHILDTHRLCWIFS